MQTSQDDFIQKKLLYKFDKKIEQLSQSIFILSQHQLRQSTKMLDEAQQKRISQTCAFQSKEAILQQIEQLRFQNFKYRTALISAQKDQASNQQIMRKSDIQIMKAQEEVSLLSKQLQIGLDCQKNKQQYNQLALSIKTMFEPLSVQKQKLESINKQIQQMQEKYQKQQIDYDKKQRCLKLALSAIKCALQTQQNQNSFDPLLNISNGASLGLQKQIPVSSKKQNGTVEADSKPNAPFSNGAGPYFRKYNNFNNNSVQQEGEQSEGGQILY